MASLLETRKKIRSISQTKKITKAMQLVSASKMKIFQKRAVSTRTYAWELLGKLEDHLGEEGISQYLKTRTTGKNLFLLYSSDKGLCGGLNTKLFKALLSSSQWQKTPAEERIVFTIGKKALDFANYNKIPVKKSFKGVKEQMSPIDALDLLKPILDAWDEGAVKNIFMIAPHYKSTLVFYPVVKTYLPVSPSMLQEQLRISENTPRKEFSKIEEEDTEDLMIYEPSKQVVTTRLFQQVIHMVFLQAFLELKASEYSSRMMAMQSATDNATEIIRLQTLEYNKARQSKITQELSEMSGTMAAME